MKKILRHEIAEVCCFPEALLTGETPEEDIAQAKAIMAMRRQHSKEKPTPQEERANKWLADLGQRVSRIGY